MRAPGGRVVTRFGPCFEAARGPAMLLEGASFEADARGHAARGTLVAAEGSGVRGADAVLVSWRGRALLRRSAGQVFAPAATVARVTLTAMLAFGLAERAAGAQSTVLLAAALAHMAYLRAFAPFRWRGDQAAEMAGAAADALTLALVLALPGLPSAARDAAGAAMVAAQLVAGAAALLVACARVGGALRRAAWPGGLLWLPPSGAQRIANAAAAAMRASLAGGEGVQERLARKYARRWLLKARRAASRRGARRVNQGLGSSSGSGLGSHGSGGSGSGGTPRSPVVAAGVPAGVAGPGSPHAGGVGSPFAALRAQENPFGFAPVCPISSPFAAAAAQATRMSSGEWGGAPGRTWSLPSAGSLGQGGGFGGGPDGSRAGLGSGLGSGLSGALGAAGLGAWASGSLAPQADLAAAAALLEVQGLYRDHDPGGVHGRPHSPLSPASAAGSRGLLPRGGSWGAGSGGGGPTRRSSKRVRLSRPVPYTYISLC